MDGVLVVDKPIGPTSHDVVSAARRALRQKKIGHTGTLDPNATGVLPLVIGRATKLARFFSGGRKHYDATVRLGVTTTTLDAVGEVVDQRDVIVSEQKIRDVVAKFIGEIDQLPPMYSAKKVEGKRLYQLARQGVEVERETKRVTVHQIDVEDIALPDLRLHIECSTGTYVRVLADDIGKLLGCGAHLKALRRTHVAPFCLDDAVELEALEQDPESGRARLIPMRKAVSHFPAIALPRDLVAMVETGYQLTVADLLSLDVPELDDGATMILTSDDGGLIAIACAEIASEALRRARRDQRAIKTERVFPRSVA